MPTDYPSDWDERRRAVYNRDDYECQNCGAKGRPHGNTELHAHHIVPKNSGGTHKLSNLKTVCHDCHRAIHNDVQAPNTAIDNTDNSDIIQKYLLQMPVGLSSIRGAFTEVEKEGSFNPSHQQFGYLFYARRIFYNAHSDVLQFATEKKTLPQQLEERYTKARDVMEYILRKRDNIRENVILELFNVSQASNRPSDELRKVVSEDSLNEMETVYELIDDLKEKKKVSAPQEFDEFLRSTKKLIETVDREFELYKKTVVIGENGTVTLATSVENEWERKEVKDEIRTVIPHWTQKFSELSTQGMNEISQDNSEDCFIATAAMGRSDQKEVMTLRNFRDDVLKQSLLGQTLIRSYYYISPPIAKWIGQSKWRRSVVRFLVVLPAAYIASIINHDTDADTD